MTQGGAYELTGNPAQITAICHVNGPAIVVAGPGSGKTFVITNRLRFLIEHADADPSSILVITFTKAAALQMQSRFNKLTNNRYPEVNFGTFHSIFWNILKKSKKNFRADILSANDKIKILGQALNKVLFTHKDELNKDDEQSINKIDNINAILSEISRVKNDGGILNSDFLSDDLPYREYFFEIYGEYVSLCHSLCKIDFDDMVLDCYKMLKENEKILDFWQNAFDYVLIDEYQDINRIQEEVVRMLVRKKRNIFVVGDDDQSIYAFRGSRPEIMHEFLNIYKDAKLIKLSINYRCGKDIVDMSSKVIEENVVRIDKKMEAANDDNKGFVSIKDFINPELERKYIVEKIKNIIKETDGKSLDDIAILYRTNALMEPMITEFISENIDFTAPIGITSLYENSRIVTLLSYLDFVAGGRKREDFLKLMNHPARYIRREAVSKSIVEKSDLVRFYRQDFNMMNVVDKLFISLDFLGKMGTPLAISYLLNQMGMQKYLYEGLADDKKEFMDSYIAEIKKDAVAFPNIGDFLKNRDEKVIDMKKTRESAKKLNNKGVKLMTMHSSKGLEFEHVFLPGLNEGVVPSKKSVTKEQIEEERRMFYVAMTRAKENLYMSYVSGTEGGERMPSRFLRKILPKTKED